MACRPTDIPFDIKNIQDLLFVRKEDWDVISYGGWKKELLVEEIATKSEEKLLQCTLCKGMLRDACVIIVNGKKEARCDVCVANDYAAGARKIAELVRSVIDEKMVYCPMLSEDCSWNGPTIEIISHLKNCQFLPIPCPLGCIDPDILHSKAIQKIQRKLLPNHLNNSCPMRLIPCEYCRTKIRASNFNAHLSICDEYPIPCPNQCTVQSADDEVFTTSRKIIQNHLNTDCPLQEVRCPYSEHGCADVVVRKDFQTHMLGYQAHLCLFESCLKDAKVKLQTQIDDNIKKKQNKHLEVSGVEWRSTYFKQKKNKRRAFTSFPFYTSGYKLRFIVQFNNDNYIGVYIQLLQGEYDDELAWPFNCQIKFILVNDIYASHNFEHRFDTSLLENFNKPTAHRLNDKFGFHKFISHSDIESFAFCADDSLLIRVLTKIL